MTRRRTLVTGTAGLVSLSGCIGQFRKDSGPSEKSFELTISESNNDLTMTVDPVGDVKNVISLVVGDKVTFIIQNEFDETVGLHHHTNDEELIIESNEVIRTEYSVTEDMIGRHEIEGWVVDGHGGHDTENDGHGGGHNVHHVRDHEAIVLITVEVRPIGS